MKTIYIIYFLFVLCSAVALATPSFINNTGRVYLGENVSIGTTESLGKLNVNGSIYQNQFNPKIVGYRTNSVRLDGATGVYVSGKYAYVTANANDSLSIIDVSNPTSPTIVGSVTNTRLHGAEDVYVSGKYAYVTAATNDSLSIIDISNSSSPVIVGSVTGDRLDYARNVYVSGKYAYVTSEVNSSLSIIDVSNPTSPTVVGALENTTLLLSAFDVYVSGRYAYVVAQTLDYLSIIDISNSSSPVIVGSIANNTRLDGARSVYVSGKYAYVAALNNNSLTIVDVSNSSSPVIVGFVTDVRLSNAYYAYVSGKYAYVTSIANDSLSIIDVSNPTSPTIVGSVTDVRLDSPADVYVSGKYAYVAALSNDSLSIIDIGGIDSPAASIGAVETGSLSVTENAVVANDLYVGNGISAELGGIYSQGPVSIFVSAANSVTAALNIIVNTTTVLFVGTSGNVGINTSSPTSLLHVAGSANISDTLYSGGCIGCTASNRITSDVSISGLGGASRVNISNMNFTVGANETWKFVFYIGTNSTSPDMIFSITGPLQAVCSYTLTGDGGTSIDSGWQQTCAKPINFITVTPLTAGVILHGTVATGNYTGPVTLEVSRVGLSGTVTVLRGGHFKATKINDIRDAGQVGQ